MDPDPFGEEPDCVGPRSAPQPPAAPELQSWWKERRQRFQQQNPLIPSDMVASAEIRQKYSYSWLAAARVNAHGGVGCIACLQAMPEDADEESKAFQWAGFRVRTQQTVSPWNFKRHRESKTHLQSVRLFIGLTVEKQLDDVTPPAEHFGKVWDALRNGAAPYSGVDGVGKQHKIEKFAWCLAESMWSLDREFLKDDVCITLMRDERKQRLLCRFRAARPDLTVRSGVMGQAKDFGTGSDNITSATKRIIQTFTAAGFGTRKQANDAGLFRHICARIVHLAIDAASDELLGARQLRTGNRDDLQPLCPNLKAIVRDRPHGSRRRPSVRPTMACPCC